MKPQTLSLVVVALAALTAACGSDDHGNPSSSGGSYITWDSTASELAAQADVRCEGTASQCQRGAAQLYAEVARTSTSTSYSICTAFIITPELAMTNSHCLPTGMEAGTPCGDKVFLKFPSGPGLAAEVATCQTIVSRSNIDTQSEVDYAVLRLATPVISRTPFSLDQSALRDHAPLTLYRITPSSANGAPSPGGTLHVTPCLLDRATANPDAPRGSEYNRAEYLAGCEVVEGNSGSAVVNNRGRAVGVLSHSYTSATAGDGHTAGTIVHGGRMTSLGCLSFAHAPRRIPRSCF